MSGPTFIVLSLPRSRSAWLAEFLSYAPDRCGHDLAVECGSIADFLAFFDSTFTGTIETGAVVAWRAIRKIAPEARLAAIRRPVMEVLASFSAIGIGSPELDREMHERAAMLDAFAREPGVLSMNFDALIYREACAGLFEHCLQKPLDLDWYDRLCRRNIQADVRAQLMKVLRNKDRIAALKKEAGALA